MGPHRICMCFVFRNMLTLSLSLSIGTNEATPLASKTRLLPICTIPFLFPRDFSVTIFPINQATSNRDCTT